MKTRYKVLMAAILTGRIALGQVLYGSVVGNVTDSSGAAVPGATVRITQADSNESRETQTNDHGFYSFPAIAAGQYTVAISKSGFETVTQEGITIRNDTTLRVDLVLAVGVVTESVHVTAESEVLQTDGADVRAELGSQTLENIPVFPGRNFQNLLITVPGLTPPQNSNSVSSNPARSLAFMASGVERSGNVMTIDGASVESTWLQQVAAYVPSLESIEVVNVEANAMDASQGFAGGAAVNVQVKSGTNQVHGSAFEYNFNNAMIAKPFFLPAGQPNPKSILNQFGGTLGGPIVKQKLFYFVSYDGALTRQTASAFGTVPTAAIRSGNMSADPTPIYDPSSGNPNGTGRTPFPGNVIPPDRLDKIALKIANLTPLPTFPNLLTNNYYATGPYSYSRDTTDAKVNYYVTAKLNVSVRFGWIYYTMDDPPMFGAIGGSALSSAGGAEGFGLGNVFSNTVTANYVLSPRLVIDAYFGYTLLDSNVEPPGLDQRFGLNLLGIPGTNGADRASGGWPAFSISSYSSLGNQSTVPFYFHNGNYQYVFGANWTNGTHTVRFGVDTLRKGLNMFQELNQASGAFSFGTGTTGLNGGPAQNQYNTYASFLLGLPSSFSKGEENGNNINTEWFYSLYLQDKWQATRKLTLSYGLRWEYYAFPTGDMERYNATTNTISICGVGSVPSDCGIPMSKRLFSPRVGLAYRPSEGLVIRAGYGISYDPFFIGQQILRNYPYQISYSVSGPNAYQPAGTLESGIPPLASPLFGNGIISLPGTISVNSMGDHYTRSYIQNWNFTLQKKLKWGFTGQAGYVATRQVHQQYEVDVNAGQLIGAGAAGQPLNARFGRTASTKFFEPLGSGHYDALQATLQRRFAQGYQIQANYSWSKAIGLCCADSEDAGPQINIPAYVSRNRAVEPFDRTQVLTVSGSAELPLGRGKRWAPGGVLSTILSGWQLNVIFSAYTGLPFTITSSTTSLNAPDNAQVADQIKPSVAILGGIGSTQAYFDPLAFAPVTAARFGSAGFNSLRGPGAINADTGLFRTFHATERVAVQFRGQVFNVTNTPHFANPAANVSNLVLNPDGSIKVLGGFAAITSTTGAGREGIDQRVFQFALRVNF